MMWNNLPQHGLTQLPQERIHFTGKTNNPQLFIYILLDHLHCNNRCCPNLDFLFTPTAQLYLILNLFLELFGVLHDFVLVQDLRHSVVGKHCQLVDVFELSEVLALIHTPNASH